MHLLACDLLLVNSGMSRQCHTNIVKVEQHWSILSNKLSEKLKDSKLDISCFVHPVFLPKSTGDRRR